MSSNDTQLTDSRQAMLDDIDARLMPKLRLWAGSVFALPYERRTQSSEQVALMTRLILENTVQHIRDHPAKYGPTLLAKMNAVLDELSPDYLAITREIVEGADD